jgi:hypothetical protein
MAMHLAAGADALDDLLAQVAAFGEAERARLAVSWARSRLWMSIP